MKVYIPVCVQKPQEIGNEDSVMRDRDLDRVENDEKMGDLKKVQRKSMDKWEGVGDVKMLCYFKYRKGDDCGGGKRC